MPESTDGASVTRSRVRRETLGISEGYNPLGFARARVVRATVARAARMARRTGNCGAERASPRVGEMATSAHRLRAGELRCAVRISNTQTSPTPRAHAKLRDRTRDEPPRRCLLEPCVDCLESSLQSRPSSGSFCARRREAWPTSHGSIGMGGVSRSTSRRVRPTAAPGGPFRRV